MTFEAAPGGLQEAVLFRAVGTYSGPVMVEVYRAISGFASEGSLNVLGDTRAAEAFLDTASFETVSRSLVECGVRRLNVVLCDQDAGRAYVARLGGAISRIHGLEVETRVLPTMLEAVAALAEMIANRPDP